ncbi:MAG: hypothetical protein AB7J86_17215 [Vulcanimicrobiota bacterium]
MRSVLRWGIYCWLLSGLAWAQAPDYSGMAEMPGRFTYFVVHDTKAGVEPPWAARVGVLRLSKDGKPNYQSLNITNWGPGQELPNDIECCCPLPGRAGEFLVAESGYYHGRFGRIFRLRVQRVPGSELYFGEVLGHFQFDQPGADGDTEDARQLEGIACIEQDGQLILVLGRRGGNGQPGELIWGPLALDPMRFGPTQVRALDLGDHRLRACSDLLWHRGELLCVASYDPGNLGPFQSFVYSLGKRDWQVDPQRLWVLDGLKVEALAPCSLPGSELCVGTDDEDYQGIWRPLGERP